MLKKNKEIVVSVCMVTYNHEPFIRQAIESALMQETSFNYEIMIGEDCSTDQTRSLVKKYKLEFPDKITLILNEQNVGAVRNMAAIIKASRGKYIALLDGDDYWTAPDKLQKQVDFLESNPEYSTCYHGAQLIDKSGKPQVVIPLPKFRKKTSNLEDLIQNDVFMASGSTMFRAKLFDYFPDIFFVLRNGCDWALSVLNAEHGLIGYIDETMSVYRSASSDFAWTSRPITEIYPDAIRINEEFNAYFDFRYDKIFKYKLAKYHCFMANDYLRQGYIMRAFEELRKSVQKQWVTKLILSSIFFDGPLALVKGLLLRRLPKLHQFLKFSIHKIK